MLTIHLPPSSCQEWADSGRFCSVALGVSLSSSPYTQTISAPLKALRGKSTCITAKYQSIILSTFESASGNSICSVKTLLIFHHGRQQTQRKTVKTLVSSENYVKNELFYFPWRCPRDSPLLYPASISLPVSLSLPTLFLPRISGREDRCLLCLRVRRNLPALALNDDVNS